MIYLFNTLTRKKGPFKPLEKGAVSMYHCGPTVYDRAHIGNLRSFITWDILRRVFESQAFTVNQVMNVTDVDDKTIKRSREEGVSLKKLTERHTDFFVKDINSLNILTPHKLIKATDHIDEMIALIEQLLKKGLAYKSADGSVYFKISAFKKYGQLARLKIKTLERTDRVRDDNYDKENIRDFVLWKSWTEEDGNVFWQTQLGKGRPGWHIECSAMSMKYLGEEFDIHTGGKDLIFPHHTNEIAQSEGVTGKQFVRYWLHNEFVLVDGQKMAKSEGNIITLNNIAEKGFNPLSYRYFLLQAHYRTQINFTWNALRAAQNALQKLYEQYGTLPNGGGISKTYQKKFVEIVNNDLDTPQALALLWQLMKDNAVTPEDKKNTLAYFDEVLGLGLQKYKPAEAPEKVRSLMELREYARKKEDFKTADNLRFKIERLGFTVKDTPSGPRIYKSQ